MARRDLPLRQAAHCAEPAVNIGAADTGAVAVIRHIARADERPAMRSRPSHEIIGLLHRGDDPVEGAAAVPDAEAAAFGRRRAVAPGGASGSAGICQRRFRGAG